VNWPPPHPPPDTPAFGLGRNPITDDEASRLEAPDTSRYDFQGISDDAELARISARIGIKPANE
jgi:hypothetical protein